MSMSLLSTKLHRPPVGPRLVARPQLLQRLLEGHARGEIPLTSLREARQELTLDRLKWDVARRCLELHHRVE